MMMDGLGPEDCDLILSGVEVYQPSLAHLSVISENKHYLAIYPYISQNIEHCKDKDQNANQIQVSQ